METTSTQISSTLPSGFTENYIDYAKNLTDAPEIYHKFLSLSLLSLAVGRTPISITPTQLYPNFWLILIGASGITRKTSAMKLALDVLPDDHAYLPNDFSPEALQQSLSEQNQGLIWKEEIGGFLESMKKKDYMSGTADLLCQLFDCPDRYSKTLRSQRFDLSNVCFNIIAATTPSRFLETVKPSDFNSGFQSRFLIVTGEKTKNSKRRKWTTEDTQRRDNCKTKWKQIFDSFHSATSSLRFEFEDEALERINSWGEINEEELIEIENPTEKDLKGAINARMADYIVKIAALYEVDKLCKTNVSMLVTNPIQISEESVKKACSDIDNLLTQLSTNLLSLLTTNSVQTKLKKLTSLISKKADGEGWVQHRDLLPLMNIEARDFAQLVETALQSDAIELKHKGAANFYRLKTSDTVAKTLDPSPLLKTSILVQQAK